MGGQPCSNDSVLVDANGTPFCIDATEVTSGAYDAFLASGPRGDSMPGCEWNDDLAPLEVAGLGVPVRVDHCDAQAYCAWAGKRLCGRVGGGFIRAGTADFTTTESEWFYACSAGGTQRYPYGDELTQGACIDQSVGLSDPAPVRSADDCEGGFAGIHDLTGNVAEWTDICNPPAGGANDLCPVRGGDFTVNVACDSWEAASRSSRGFGVRCCSDPR
jgi:formylglycine-generating enzyme required for sulfatase activity